MMENINPLTESVKELKMYLKSFGSGGISEEVLELGVMKILLRSTREDKAFLHMTLFFHAELHSSSTRIIDYVQDNPDDFLGLLPSLNYNSGFSLDLYSRLVLDGGLTHHFFQMLAALPRKYSVEVEGAVTRIVDLISLNLEQYYDVYLFVMLMLVKLSRPVSIKETNMDDNEEGIIELYHELLMKLVKSYYIEFQGISREERLSTLLRLGGVACMGKEEYESSGNDLGELLEEYDFDMSNRLATDTKIYFDKLLNSNHNSSSLQVEDRSINPKTLQFLSDTLKELNFCEDEFESFKAKKKTSKVLWLDYIGVTAFLSKSIFEKRLMAIMRNEDEDIVIQRDKIETILSQSNLWSKYRPKLTIEDYEKDIADFNQFFVVIRKFGQKEKVRLSLLNQFLKFSYSEIYLKRDGLKVTDKYLIPGATYEIAVEYMKKSMDSNLMPEGLLGVVPEIVKIAVLKMMCVNQNVRDRRDDVVREIFPNGSHAKFTMNSYTMDVAQVCSKLGSMEKETDSKLIEHNRDLIFNVCFQNPSSSLESLLTQAIKSRKFKALEIAMPFFSIPSMENTLIEDCFKGILNALDEADPTIGLIEAAIPSLLDHKILEAHQVFLILKTIYSESMNKPDLDLGKLEKMFPLLESLVKHLKSMTFNNSESEEEDEDGNHNQSSLQIFKEIGAYAVEIAAITCCSLSKKNLKSMIAIRQSCYSIMHTTKTEITEELTLDPGECYITLECLGFLYVRIPKSRPQVVSLINQIDTKSVSYEKGMDYLITWVINSEPKIEWQSCIELLHLVIYPKFSTEWDLAHPLYLINQSTYVVFEVSVFANDHVFIRQWLKFYKQFVANIWKKKPGISYDCQLSILRTLVTLSVAIRKVAELKDKSRVVQANLENTMQQLLLLVLDIVNLIVVKHTELDSDLKEKILDIVTLLPANDLKYSSIYRCITERILKEKKSSFLPLPKEDEMGDEENEPNNLDDASSRT